MHTAMHIRSLPTVLFACLLSPAVSARQLTGPTECLPNAAVVESQFKISDPDLGGALGDVDHLGCSIATIGDLDGNGVQDLAVGAYEDDDGGQDRGAVYVLLMQSGGLLQYQKISSTFGNFAGPLADGDGFGLSVAYLGTLQCPDGSFSAVAVGAIRDDDGASDAGAVWILLLESNGTVHCAKKISATQGGFTGILNSGDLFGQSVISLGDFDEAGGSSLAIAVGAPRDDSAGVSMGAVWIIFLDSTGMVHSTNPIKIYDGAEGFLGFDSIEFGLRLASADLDGNGSNDLFVGDSHNSIDGAATGAVWALLLQYPASPTVLSQHKISNSGLGGIFTGGDAFGYSVATLHVNDDSVIDLAVGAIGDIDLPVAGAVYLLQLTASGTVDCYSKISGTRGGFTGHLDLDDEFGSSVAPIDLNGDDQWDELAVGAQNDDDDAGGGTGLDRGAVWVLSRTNPLILPYCFGNGATIACPCMNEATDMEGCKNSSDRGANLEASAGTTSVLADDLILSATQLPQNQFGIFYMGGGFHGVLFGDGLRCVSPGGIGLFRYLPPQNSGALGQIVLGPGIVAHSQSFPPAGHIVAGATWHFQAWYRDPTGPCGTAFNLSNALAVTFTQ